MADTVTTSLKKAEKAMVKLRNNMKRADLDYTVQLSLSSVDPGRIRYAAQMTAPANGLAPVTFIADTPAELIEMIKAQQKKLDEKAVEIAYHEAQIAACERTKAFHEERIKQLTEPEGETDGQEETAN